jgi:hypothetical protein
MKLPNADAAIIPDEKLQAYCLNPEHGYGQHKAFLFSKLLGIAEDNAHELRNLLEAALRQDDVIRVQPTGHGTIYYIDSLVVRGERSFILRSLWIILFGEIIPRFVSCYIRRKGSKIQ